MSESVDIKPSSFEEAMQQPIWFDAIVEEYDSIIKNSVWKVVQIPVDKLMVSSIWLYKVKQTTDGSVEKHKARGFSQVDGIDYEETFSPIQGTLLSDLFYHFLCRWDGAYIRWM